MRTRFLLSFLLLSALTGYCTTFTIVSNGFTFSPATMNINTGDDVIFSLASIHNAVEVSKSTWDANGTTPLAGGFSTGTGGGHVASSFFTPGAHYYVCQFHVASNQMKGVITVNALGVQDNQLQANISLFPNPTSGVFSVKVSDNVLGSPYIFVDEAGRQIFQGEFNETSTSLNISNLEAGIYFLQIGHEKGQTFKVVKK